MAHYTVSTLCTESKTAHVVFVIWPIFLEYLQVGLVPQNRLLGIVVAILSAGQMPPYNPTNNISALKDGNIRKLNTPSVGELTELIVCMTIELIHKKYTRLLI